jgi:hypothetical protein
MEEVAGGAAILVDPLSVAEIAAGIREAAPGATSSHRPVWSRAQEHTWQRTADAVVELWSELA